MNTDLFGITIQLDSAIATDADIGICAVPGYNSQIRISEAPLLGVSELWVTGLIAENGIGEYVQSADLSRGGGVVSCDGMTIRLTNTNQLFQRWKSLGINLNNLFMVITEFIGTSTDTDAFERSTFFSGFIDDIQWNETELTIHANNARDSRRANLATVIANGANGNYPNASESENGKIVPITFGESNPSKNTLFQSVRTNAKNNVLTVADLSQTTDSSHYYPPNMDLFPVTGLDSGNKLTAVIRVGRMDSTALPNGDSFIGKYALCKEGAIKNAGGYRKIIDAGNLAFTDGEASLKLWFEDYWPVDFSGNYAGTATDQTWLQIIDLERNYETDTWPCKGFFDTNGNQLPNAAEIYADDNGTALRLPPYGCDIDIDNTDNNSLIINPKLFEGNPDDMLSYLILPVTNFGLCTDSSLSNFGLALGTKITNGIYGRADYVSAGHLTIVSNSGLLNSSRILDKDYNSYAEFNLQYQQDGAITPNGHFTKAFVFQLPVLPDSFVFDKAYIGIKFWSSYSNAADTDFSMHSRGYINRSKTIVSGSTDETDGFVSENIPDFYYSPNASTYNQNFIRETPPVSGKYSAITGLSLYELQGATNLSSYNAIEQILLKQLRSVSTSVATDLTEIYSLCVIIESKGTIKDRVLL